MHKINNSPWNMISRCYKKKIYKRENMNAKATLQLNISVLNVELYVAFLWLCLLNKTILLLAHFN